MSISSPAIRDSSGSRILIDAYRFSRLILYSRTFQPGCTKGFYVSVYPVVSKAKLEQTADCEISSRNNEGEKCETFDAFVSLM